MSYLKKKQLTILVGFCVNCGLTEWCRHANSNWQCMLMQQYLACSLHTTLHTEYLNKNTGLLSTFLNITILKVFSNSKKQFHLVRFNRIPKFQLFCFDCLFCFCFSETGLAWTGAPLGKAATLDVHCTCFMCKWGRDKTTV